MKQDESQKSVAPKFNLGKLIKACLRSWKLFAASIILCGGIAAVLAYLKVPAYEVDAQLMLKSDDGGGMMGYSDLARSFSFGDMLGMSSSTDNEVAVLQSHAVFLQTVKDLRLNVNIEKKIKFVKWVSMYTKSPISIELPPELCDTLTATLYFDLERNGSGDTFDITVKAKKKKLLTEKGQALPCRLETPYGSFTIGKTDNYEADGSGHYRISVGSYDGTAELWEKLVTIFAPNRKTDFIALSVVTPDPEFGKLLLNTIIDNYNNLGNDEKNLRNNNSLKLITDRLTVLKEEMQQTEQAMADFKSRNGITSPEADVPIALSRKATLDEALLKAQTEAEILKMTLGFLKDEKNKYELVPDLLSASGSMTSGSQAASTQIATYNELIIDRMRMVGSARENNAALQQLEKQIDAMRANIVETVQRAYNNARVELSKVQAEVNKADSRISDIPELERQYVELSRLMELQNQLYAVLQQQQVNIELSLASRTISAVTIDAPHVLAEPVGLSKMKMLILGLLIGALIPLLLVYFLRMRKAPLASGQEIAGALQAPLLCTLRKDRNAPALWALDRDDVNADALRRLRSDVLSILGQCSGTTVTVTSGAGAEGRSGIAVNLALSMALIGKRVLVIDGDMHTPSVASLLGIPSPANALADYASGAPALDIRRAGTDAATVDVVTATAAGSAHPADILATARVWQALSDIKKSYDCIIVDAASLDGHSDAYDWGAVSDVTLVVVTAGKVDADSIALVNNLYTDARLPRIAVVANCC